MPDLLRNCINVAVEEINFFANFKVKITAIRKGGALRGKVTGFRVSWCAKSAEELKEAYNEIKRPKVGRKARLKGKVETVLPYMPLLDPETAAQLLAEDREKLEKQRRDESAKVAAE
jgi:hypothetical protein